jgi:hypothetical protein
MSARRTWVLRIALAATLLASAWALLDPAEAPLDASTTGVEPMPREAREQSPLTVAALAEPAAESVSPQSLRLPQRGEPGAASGDPFGSDPFAPPPRPRVVATAPPPPEPVAPPPLPFTYGGRLTIGADDAVLLLDGGRTVTVLPGAQIGEFRFDAHQGSSLLFTHLPTGAPVTLALPPP